MQNARIMVPQYYYDDPNTAAVLNALDRTGSRMLKAIEDHLLQLNVTTATWGLPLWEARYGIIPASGASLETRRSNVMSKMRGLGTVTVELVQNVANAWKNGTVTVDEAAQGITLTFSGQLGIPDDIDALVDAIRAVLPAGLEINYNFRFLLIREIHETMTLAQLEQTKLENFAGGTYHV